MKSSPIRPLLFAGAVVLLLAMFTLSTAGQIGSRGTPQAAVATATPPTVNIVCNNQPQCREIDEVWMRMGSLIRSNDDIWDIVASRWQNFNVVYPAPISTSRTSSSTPSGTIPANACFPVVQNDFKTNTLNFGSPRDNGARCHAGIDLFTQGDGKIVAVDDGEVLNIHQFKDCSGGPADALLIYHPHLLGGVTINYGEMNRNDIAVQRRQSIRRGQYLGKATSCQSGGDTMLHFELYQGSITAAKSWDDLPPALVTTDNQCANEQIFLDKKPPELLNPTSLLNQLNGNFCQPS